MAVTPSYLAHVIEQLKRVVPDLRTRRMFGEAGLYAGDAFFAIVADDVLYFKVDDASRAEFESRGMPPFRPFEDGRASMNYYQVPEDVFEDPDALRSWADRAIVVARRKKGRSSRRGGARNEMLVARAQRTRPKRSTSRVSAAWPRTPVFR